MVLFHVCGEEIIERVGETLYYLVWEARELMGQFDIQLLCAFASDDGINFCETHFGDAKFYLLYAISKDRIEYIEQIDNTSIKLENHAAPEKAKSVSSLLKKKNVQVLVSRIFGPNIKRVKAHFVPVIVKKREIQEAIIIVRDNLNEIEREWKKQSSQRKHLIL
jgi:predicted Fe-Mo cluster-binding NifX family protein